MDRQGGVVRWRTSLMKSEHTGCRELTTGRKALAIVGSLFVVLESLRIIESNWEALNNLRRGIQGIKKKLMMMEQVRKT